MRHYKLIILALLAILAFGMGYSNGLMKTTSQTDNSQNNNTSIIKEFDKLTNIYINKKFKFSVEYPNNWIVKEEVYYKESGEYNASPDGGINIFIEGTQDEKIYVFGREGHINFQNSSFQRDSFITNSGLKGTLFSKEINGEKVIYLILDEDFHGAYLNISSECFNQNKGQIMDILKSIKIIN